jgi:CDP-glycerol glycerophosphotransferase (TagB/SpsB family)
MKENKFENENITDTEPLFKKFKQYINYKILPILFPIVWIFVKIESKSLARFFKRRKYRVLLVAQNRVAADHINILWNLLSGDPSIEFKVTNDRIPNKHLSKNELSRIISAPIVNILFALFQHWDLIIYVNHPWGFGVWFAPHIKKVYVNHGIWVGKINNDKSEDGVYGRSRVVRPFSTPLYDKMFAASFYEKEQALILTPELDNHLSVTGYVRADNLLETHANDRDDIRRAFGFNQNDVVVCIMSTWGPASLFQTIGEQLLQEAITLLDKYKFIFTLHPRYDEHGDTKGRKRDEILDYYRALGITTVNNLEWEEYVVASDVAVSDHTSLCLYFVLLDKPVILTPVSSEYIMKGSSFDRLKKISPHMSSADELEYLIDSAVSLNSGDEYAALKSIICSYPRASRSRYKEEIYELLER